MRFKTDPRLTVGLGTVLVLASIGGLCYLAAPPALPTFLVASTAFNLVIGATEARWRLYGWRDPGGDAEIAWPDPLRPGDEKLSFDLIVPLRDEANVIGETLRGLLRQTTPGCTSWSRCAMTTSRRSTRCARSSARTC